MKAVLKDRSFWFGFLTLGTAAAIYLVTQHPFYHPERTASGELPVYGQVAAFKLTERNGAEITPENFKGKIWIADFIFTRCAGICPMMSSRMRLLQEKLKSDPTVRLVSFSVDPEHDTPPVLSEYAKRFEADPNQWLFLTGDKNQIFQLSKQHFYLAVGEIPPGEREAPDQSVDHSSKFALVDAAGRIRGYYASEEGRSIDALVHDVERLKSEKS